MKNLYGMEITVTAWIMTKNGWEFYLGKKLSEFGKDQQVYEAVVYGLEDEGQYGTVDIHEIKPYFTKIHKVTKKDLEGFFSPAPGWSWNQ